MFNRNWINSSKFINYSTLNNSEHNRDNLCIQVIKLPGGNNWDILQGASDNKTIWELMMALY